MPRGYWIWMKDSSIQISSPFLIHSSRHLSLQTFNIRFKCNIGSLENQSDKSCHLIVVVQENIPISGFLFFFFFFHTNISIMIDLSVPLYSIAYNEPMNQSIGNEMRLLVWEWNKWFHSIGYNVYI